MPGCKTVDNNLPYYSYRPRIDDWVITGAHAIEEETNRMDAAQHCWISATQKGTGMIVLIYIYILWYSSNSTTTAVYSSYKIRVHCTHELLTRASCGCGGALLVVDINC